MGMDHSWRMTDPLIPDRQTKQPTSRYRLRKYTRRRAIETPRPARNEKIRKLLEHTCTLGGTGNHGIKILRLPQLQIAAYRSVNGVVGPKRDPDQGARVPFKK
jgi:hypothetical protein